MSYKVNVTFNFDINSIDKTRSIVTNVGRALMKKMILMLRSKEIDTIYSADIYDTYKDFYLNEREHEEKLLQGVQLGVLQGVQFLSTLPRNGFITEVCSYFSLS